MPGLSIDDEEGQPVVDIDELDERYQGWALALLIDEWHGPIIVSRGQVYDASQLPGFVAVFEDRPVGLVTYRLDGDSCELITLNSTKPETGIGSALVNRVKQLAAHAGCDYLWLITTNDNLSGLRFYQEEGFVLVALNCNALNESRRLKPQIPQIGKDGIPLRDELELAYYFDPQNE